MVVTTSASARLRVTARSACVAEVIATAATSDALLRRVAPLPLTREARQCPSLPVEWFGLIDELTDVVTPR